jgi:hypothetical protein
MILKLFPERSLLLFNSSGVNRLNTVSLRVKRSNLIQRNAFFSKGLPRKLAMTSKEKN